MVINQSLYKDRVIFLVGAGLDQEDMKRFHPEGALAVFVVGDRFAVDKRREDEENTLRAWAIDDYTQQAANLYVSNLLPETKIFQEKAASGVVCIDDIKQIVLAHTSLCSGSAAVLINLIHKYTPHDQYRQTWTALYGDGAGNEMYTDEVNPAFDKQKFTDVAWYLYREFQAIMVAVLCYDKAHNEYHLLLNPGATYHFKKEDKYVLIAQGPQEISDIRNLTREEFNSSVLKDGEAYGSLKEDEESVQMFTPMTDRFEDSFFPVYEDSIIGTPSPHYSDQNVQFCHLRKTAAFLHECIIPDTQDLCDHFVVCTRHFKLFQFVCTLRAAYLTAEDVRPIVFISEQPPTETEFEVLSVFPRIYFIIGDPRTEKDLIRAGVTKARKVIIFSLSFQNGNQFSDSTSIMISHLIYSDDVRHRPPHPCRYRTRQTRPHRFPPTFRHPKLTSPSSQSQRRH
ncbi:calcium-activated BK potassium channel alpha subunit-domain-containing protein [Chytridium lagenaria]|nr:calcium-activated BK potassium channel alpha subunit-domain-containing protein [Chytridium lagenaria]